jgi:multimeric flavodoxin WrbA
LTWVVGSFDVSYGSIFAEVVFISESSIYFVGRFDVSFLPNYDSIVLGSPTYFSNVAWQVKKVIDESIVHYSGGKLKGKVAGIFTSAGTSRDGKDCLKMLEIALGFHHGMKVVEGILRVDGESDKEAEKRCQEYARRLVKEFER